jgi:integrase/recombinase XerD
MKHITSSQGIDCLVDAYQQHLRYVKGLAPDTCAHRARQVQEFLIAQGKKAGGDLVFSRLGGEQILKYLLHQRSRCKPVSLQHLASTLRSFLRFLTLTGHCSATLVHAVPKIQAGPRVASPHYLSEAQLRSLLSSLDPQTPGGARDQAVVYCLAKLGLRAGEVAHLSLEDLDWQQGILRLTQTKGRHERLLPLSPTVGKAVAHYLRLARPAITHRRVFVWLPGGAPLSSAQVSRLTAAALRRAGLVFPRLGAQLLRRTFATHLTQKGASVKAVADLLGHRYLNCTQLYAHVNLPMLQEVAQPWPEVSL